MHRLTREVRLGLTDASPSGAGNGWAAVPIAQGVGQYVAVRVSVSGEPEAETGYVLNIRQIDHAVREALLPMLRQSPDSHRLALMLPSMLAALGQRLARVHVDGVQVLLSPQSSLQIIQQPDCPPMLRLNHSFEFSASHRLHNPQLSDAENRAAFGKCNNPRGHGHNYVVQVSISGEPDPRDGQLMPIGELERIVDEVVIERFDHKHLNLDTAEFAQVNPSVENIARTIFDLLEKPLSRPVARLEAVTVWETPKTWCEYSR